MNNLRMQTLISMLSALAAVAPPDPRREFLLSRGWVSLGAEALTGVEAWGKVIKNQAVTVPIHEALQMEGWTGERRVEG